MSMSGHCDKLIILASLGSILVALCVGAYFGYQEGRRQQP